MPLDPLPSNTTPVLFVHYAVNGVQHTMQFRGHGDVDFNEVQLKAEAFCNALMPIADPSWVITGCDWRETGSIIALPVTPITVDTATGDAIPATRNPLEHRFVGRGKMSGRRVTISVYGLDCVLQAGFRVTSGMSGAIDDAIGVLNGPDSAAATTVEGDPVLWYPYVNQNFNSHWETEARS